MIDEFTYTLFGAVFASMGGLYWAIYKSHGCLSEIKGLVKGYHKDD